MKFAETLALISLALIFVALPVVSAQDYVTIPDFEAWSQGANGDLSWAIGQIQGITNGTIPISGESIAPAEVKDRVIFNGSNSVYSISGMAPEHKTVEFNGDNLSVSWTTWNGSTSANSMTPKADAAANSRVGAEPAASMAQTQIQSAFPVQYLDEVRDDNIGTYQQEINHLLANGPVQVRGEIVNGVFHPSRNGSVTMLLSGAAWGEQTVSSI